MNIELGGGLYTKVYYSSLTKSIYGLRRFLRKYKIDEDYVLFFDYLGNSTFAVKVFDCQCMNHFRDIEGFFRFEDFIHPPADVTVVNISDNDIAAEGIDLVMHFNICLLTLLIWIGFSYSTLLFVYDDQIDSMNCEDENEAPMNVETGNEVVAQGIYTIYKKYMKLR